MRLIDVDVLLRDLNEHSYPVTDNLGEESRGMFLDDIKDEADQQIEVEVPQWIPCSERLPKEEDCYLVTMNLVRNERFTYMLGYQLDMGWFIDERDIIPVSSDHVIAWAKLPKEYMGKI